MILFQCDQCSKRELPIYRSDASPQLPRFWVKMKVETSPGHFVPTHFCCLVCIQAFDVSKFKEERKAVAV